MKHSYEDLFNRCTKCHVTAESVTDGKESEECKGAPVMLFSQRNDPKSFAPAADFTGTRPADARAKANGSWSETFKPLRQGWQRHFGDRYNGDKAEFDSLFRGDAIPPVCPTCKSAGGHAPGSPCANQNVVREIRQGPESEYIVGVDPATKPDTFAIGLARAQRKHVSDAAWEVCRARYHPDAPADARQQLEDMHRRRGTVVLTVAEHDALTANRSKNADVEMCEILGRQLRASMATTKRANDSEAEWRTIAEARQVALEAAAKSIQALEAEVESLSRQLRSRAVNAEPVSTGKRWRWSPLV